MFPYVDLVARSESFEGGMNNLFCCCCVIGAFRRWFAGLRNILICFVDVNLLNLSKEAAEM